MPADRETPLSWIDDELASLDRSGLRRSLVMHMGPQAAMLRVAGHELVNFGSNDYLALANDPRLVQAAVHAAQHEGWGAGASPLLTGRTPSHCDLEQRLAAFEGTEAALVFPSGFAANLGTIPALVGPGDVIYSDELIHASLIDGCRLSRAEVQIFPHADWRALAHRLEAAGPYRRKLIVTDSLFSMEGDLAPLAELAHLAERHACMLMVDEAHATGVFGAQGRGVAEHLGVQDRVHVRMGTFSKALGAGGGFVAGSRSLIDWLINRARPYIFSTAGTAANCAAAVAALSIVSDEPWRRERVLAMGASLRMRLQAQGWNVGRSASQIIPLLVGDIDQALRLAAYLREQGLWVPAIRPPSVPQGRSQLRISLSCGHTDEMLERLCEVLANAHAQIHCASNSRTP